MRMMQNALAGALAAQAALNAASQNISNVMTPGYSRQGVILSAIAPSAGDPHSAGSGVDIQSIRRFNDQYRSLQMWQASANMGESAAKQGYLTQLEQVMSASGSSISGGLDKFYAALGAASVEPSSLALRQSVITEAGAMAQRFNNLNRVLSAQHASVNEQRTALVAQVNSLGGSIARLNKEIVAATATGVNPSGLLDERDRKIDQLSGLVDVRVVNQNDGSISVTLRAGQPLVVGDSASVMSTEAQLDGSQLIKLSFAQEKFTLNGASIGSQLGGLNEYEKNSLKPMEDAIRTLASEVAGRINGQLAAGFDLTGQPGKPLFVFDANNPQGMLKLRPGIVAEDLAFASEASKPGGSGNLQKLIDIQSQALTVAGLGTVTLSDAYAQLLGRLASESQQNQSSLATAKVVRNQSEQDWKSTSGVNRDEEAMNIIEYQKMYQANMKVIAIANQLFDSTLASFG
ncbi:flagellar hook-associated protein FlgK [Iodobacter sp. HSC-16F04]|uniref:Flagellar hook-associated protein 1 n=1 Tax=Iodobacter violaceini TaxID=3044271 RepID=A0ABX0L2T1_9NEIS|nr:flagellar hook-associated protein FlgK [Iodobacter violacea]NHQ86898.1 flagellar hook-associated protein FlgK [Iodobacter violacea]